MEKRIWFKKIIFLSFSFLPILNCLTSVPVLAATDEATLISESVSEPTPEPFPAKSNKIEGFTSSKSENESISKQELAFEESWRQIVGLNI